MRSRSWNQYDGGSIRSALRVAAYINRRRREQQSGQQLIEDLRTRFGMSRATAYRWVARYREYFGGADGFKTRPQPPNPTGASK